jgi:hypothetical protein
MRTLLTDLNRENAWDIYNSCGEGSLTRKIGVIYGLDSRKLVESVLRTIKEEEQMSL